MSFSLKIVKCCGTPHEMGLQYGEQTKEEIAKNLTCLRINEREITPAFIESVRTVLSNWSQEILEELEGISESSGVPIGQIFAFNHVDSFNHGGTNQQCTSMAINAGPDGPILGKNNDGDIDESEFVVRISNPETGLPMIQVTYAGWLSGLDSMNADGLANAHSSVGSIFDRAGEKMDVRLWTYHLMRRCSTTQQFVERIEGVPITGKGFNIVLNDPIGDTCVVEAAVPEINFRNRRDGFVFATNHFVTEPFKNADGRTHQQKVISQNRYNHLETVGQHSPPKDQLGIETVLKSHDMWGPCRHGENQVSHTQWSMIGLPQEKLLLVSDGPPCKHAYHPFDLKTI